MRMTSILAILIVSSLLYGSHLKAQDTGTALDCMDAFYDALLTWDTEASSNGRDVVCRVTSGRATVSAIGRWTGNAGHRRIVHAYFLRGAQGEKQCLVQMFRDSHDPRIEEIGRYLLRGREASAWNRFLKGEGCESAQATAGN